MWFQKNKQKIIVLLMITYIPWISTFIPNLMYGIG